METSVTPAHQIDVHKLDQFGPRAEALFFVHIQLVIRAGRAKKMPELAREGWKMRKIFVKYADLLVTMERFPDDVLGRLRTGSGYLDLIGDLGAFVSWFRDAPELAGPGALVSEEMVDRAAALAHEMRATVGTDGDVDLTEAELGAERHKLAVLLLASHREVRRGLEYLRFYEGDAAEIGPALHVRGKGRRSSASRPPTSVVP